MRVLSGNYILLMLDFLLDFPEFFLFLFILAAFVSGRLLLMRQRLAACFCLFFISHHCYRMTRPGLFLYLLKMNNFIRRIPKQRFIVGNI